MARFVYKLWELKKVQVKVWPVWPNDWTAPQEDKEWEDALKEYADYIKPGELEGLMSLPGHKWIWKRLTLGCVGFTICHQGMNPRNLTPALVYQSFLHKTMVWEIAVIVSTVCTHNYVVDWPFHREREVLKLKSKFPRSGLRPVPPLLNNQI